MANKQYIGARYVPLIDGEWNENKVYEPLTVVTYLTNSYTSKKTVPAGTLPTNTEYWVLTGNYNGMIGQLTERINEVETSTTEALEAAAEATAAALEETKTNVSDMIANLTGLKGKKILIIGDSISDEALYPNCWVKDFKDICTSLDIEVENFSLQGRTIGVYSGATNYLMNVVGNIPAGEYAEILVFLGVNDWLNQTALGSLQATDNNSVVTNMRLFYNWVRQNHSGSRVTWVLPLKSSYANDIRHRLLQFYCAAIASAATYLGFSVIDAHSFAPLICHYNMNDWMRDGVHPVDAYSPHLARFIFNNLIARTSSVGLDGILTTEAIGDVGGHADRVFALYDGIGNISYKVENYSVSGSGNVLLANLEPENYTSTTAYGVGTITASGTSYPVILLSTGSALYVYKPTGVPDGTLAGEFIPSPVAFITRVNSVTY